eukprot:gene2539-2908_t
MLIKSVFIGAKDTQTFLHKDTGDNLVSIVRGSKFIVMVPPEEEKNLLYSRDNRNERITPDNLSNHSLFQNIKSSILSCTLHAGDSLLIPINWLHYISNLEFTISLPQEAKNFLADHSANFNISNNNNNNNNNNELKNNQHVPSSDYSNTPPGMMMPPPHNRSMNDMKNQFKLGSSYNGFYSTNNLKNARDTPPGAIRFSNASGNGSSSVRSSINEEDDEMDSSDNDIRSSSEPMATQQQYSTSVDTSSLFNLYSTQKSVAQIINLRIIGRDKSGTLIIARTAKTDGIKTYVDLFDINSSPKRFRTILDYSGNIVSAALSNDSKKSFLIFTVRLPDKFADINTTNEFKVPIVTDPTGIHLTPNKKGGKKSLLFKNFFWHQYDDITQTLYALQYQKLKSLSAPSDNLFKAWTFQSGKATQLYEFSIPLHLSTDISKISTNIPSPLGITSKPEQLYQNIHIVNFSNNGQRLRYSIPLANIDGGWMSIQVTRVLFDAIGNLLMIYIPGYFLQFLDCSSDHEPCFGVTLYTDLSKPLKEASSHDSSDFVSMARTRPLPTKVSTSVVPFSMHSKTDQYMFDYANGILYSYKFKRSCIAKLFERDAIASHSLDGGTDIRALHLAMVHLQDNELVLKILVMASKEPHLISSDFLKEYILGSTYSVLRNKLDNVYLQTLPMTSTEGLDISTLKLKQLRDIELTHTISMQVPTSILAKKDDISRKRLKSFEVAKSEVVAKEASFVTGFFKNLFGVDDYEPLRRSANSFENSPMKTPSKVPVNVSLENYEENPLADLQPYANNLADYWYSISQKESRDTLLNWAISYRNVQINTVNTLYSILKKHIGNTDADPSEAIADHPKKSQLFRAMEKLYVAIEEIGCPFPKDFYSNFTILGFYCLPRNVFLQYLQKGLFVVTCSFIQELRNAFPNEAAVGQADRNFINQVILHLRDQGKMVELMQDWVDPNSNNFVLDHLILSLAQRSEDPRPESIENKMDTDNKNGDDPLLSSIFMPLASLINYLEKGVIASAASHHRTAPFPPGSPTRPTSSSHSPSASFNGIPPPPSSNDTNALNYISHHAHEDIKKMLESNRVTK